MLRKARTLLIHKNPMPPLLNRIPTQPPPGAWVVIPVAVVEQIRLLILVFGGEPEGVRLRHGARGPNDFPEGAVFVLGGQGAVGGFDEGGQVAVAVVSAKVRTERAVVELEQPAHAAGALERTG